MQSQLKMGRGRQEGKSADHCCSGDGLRSAKVKECRHLLKLNKQGDRALSRGSRMETHPANTLMFTWGEPVWTTGLQNHLIVS